MVGSTKLAVHVHGQSLHMTSAHLGKALQVVSERVLRGKDIPLLSCPRRWHVHLQRVTAQAQHRARRAQRSMKSPKICCCAIDEQKRERVWPYGTLLSTCSAAAASPISRPYSFSQSSAPALYCSAHVVWSPGHQIAQPVE